MATIKDFSVGEIAYIYGDGRRRENRDLLVEADVVKVGRKYVTVKATGGRWEMQFSEGWTNGREPFLIEKTEYGSPRLLFPTKQAAEEWIEKLNLQDLVGKAFRWDNVKKYSLEQLRPVSKIIAEGGKL